MQLLVKRKHGTVGFTDGQLFINGVYFCDTLEDEERPVKIPGVTAIRTGVYDMVIDYSTRFKRLMPRLLNVPGFTGIRIHNGNTAKHTDGCILVGKAITPGYVGNSVVTYNNLMSRLNAAKKNGERFTVTIV